MEQILQLIASKESVMLVTERASSLLSISTSEMQAFFVIAAIFEKIVLLFVWGDGLSGFDHFT